MFPKKTIIALEPASRRLPGQSLRDAKERLMENWFFPVYMSTSMFWILWLSAELQVRQLQPPQPKLYLCLAIVATGFAAIKLGRLLGVFRNLNRGERGELLVAERLEDLRSQGYRCFHDLVRDGFNIDHIVVGPAGVFAIETKFRSGSGLIEFRNGQGIFVAGREEERDALKQARGAARAVYDLIQEDAGIKVWVKPLVVFVGHWKVKNNWRNTDARVLTADGIPRYFENLHQPELLQREIELICSHLNRTARG